MVSRAAISEELFTGPISYKFDILRVDPSGISQVGNCSYRTLQNGDILTVRVSSMVFLSQGKLFEKKELYMSRADFAPVSFSAFLDGPSGKTLVKSYYRFSSSLSHLRPLNLDFYRTISVDIAHVPEGSGGCLTKQKLIIEKRPYLVDSLSVVELVRSMVAAGRPAERKIVFDTVSGLYLDCDISYIPEDESDTVSGCAGYRVRSYSRKLDIYFDEEFYFDNSPPFVLLRHRKPSQIMEISEWSVQDRPSDI